MKTPWWWMIAGIISVIGGVVALFNPFAATLTATMIVGWAFLLGGVLQLVSGFFRPGFGEKLWGILWGVVSACLGISLLVNPLAGALSLTMAVGILVIAAGTARVIFAFNLRQTPLFMPVLGLGIAGIALGCLVLYFFPESASSLLGTLLAVELLFSGIGLILASRLVGSARAAS